MKRNILIKLAAVSWLIGAVIGCGIKGPPLPPLETLGDKANNYNLVQKENTARAASGDATVKEAHPK